MMVSVQKRHVDKHDIEREGQKEQLNGKDALLIITEKQLWWRTKQVVQYSWERERDTKSDGLQKKLC